MNMGSGIKHMLNTARGKQQPAKNKDEYQNMDDYERQHANSNNNRY